MLHSIHHVKILINGIESSGEDSEVIASLYNCDVITVFREGKGFLEFFCEFFAGSGASVRDTPVTFRKATAGESLISIELRARLAVSP